MEALKGKDDCAVNRRTVPAGFGTAILSLLFFRGIDAEWRPEDVPVLIVDPAHPVAELEGTYRSPGTNAHDVTTFRIDARSRFLRAAAAG